jgi:hypothetical protein
MFLPPLDPLRHPLYQFGFFYLATVLSVPFLRRRKADTIWNLAGLFYVLFIAVNSIFQLFADSTWTYFFISVLVSAAYAFLGGSMLEYLIKALKIEGSGESAMIFLIVLYHPVVLLLMVLLRWILF